MHAADPIFRALSDPTRRAIFDRLCREGELSVHAMTREAGISQPAVSKHLGLLRDAGLVRPRPKGRETYYSAAPEALAPLAGWMAEATRFWGGKLAALEDLLKRMDQ